MSIPISGTTIAVPAAAAGTASGRELRPGDVITATVAAAVEGKAVLLAGQEEMAARTELPLAVGQVLELLVESCTGGVLTLKVVGRPDGATGRSLATAAGLLHDLGLPDTAAGRQAVAALLAQRLPLDRAAVLALTRAAGSPPLAAADIPRLVFLAARGFPLTAESVEHLEELFAGRWLAEEGVLPANGETAALLERMTLPESPPGAAAEKLAALARTGRELLGLLRNSPAGRESDLSARPDRLEILRRLNTEADAGWSFLPALAGTPESRAPLLLAVKSFRRRPRAGGEPEQRVNLLLATPHLGRLCARLRLRDGALTCRLQVEGAAVRRLADAAAGSLAAALRGCGYRATVLPCVVGRLDWLAEFWGVDGGADGAVRRVDLTV